MPDFIFPIESAEKYLRSFRSELERTADGLRWQDFDGVSELRVEKANFKTVDGLHVSERVTLSHTADWMQHLTSNDACHLNRWAVLSTFVPATATTPPWLGSKADIFSGDSGAAELVYAPLICSEAAVIGWYAAQVARGIFHVNLEHSPLLRTEDPPPFDRQAFEALKVQSDRLGYVSSLAPGYFCVEFPWESGALSHQLAWPEFREKLLASGRYSEEDIDRMGGATSLLSLSINERHPLFGNGLQCRLEIPVPYDQTTISALVDELNRWEISGQDLPPLFGAWCAGTRAPTFVTFVPNQYCVPGLLQNFLFWSLVRHSRVREWLCSPKSSH